jgi:hypothetical protein
MDWPAKEAQSMSPQAIDSSTPATPPELLATTNDDVVRAVVQIYDVQFRQDAEQHDRQEISTVLVGDKGLYWPRHQEHMVWLPADLITFQEPPKVGKVITIQLSRWLAAKKGLNYNG